jgi:predicted nucleic acid-binding protein
MIVDSGVWIDHFRDRETAPVGMLRDILRGEKRIELLPIILQEVLQGTRSETELSRYQSLLSGVPLAEGVDARESAVLAARLYAALRWRGVTVPPSDCLIAAACGSTGEPLLTADKDFVAIKAVLPSLTLIEY